jgi:hypothetical protein
MAHPLRGLLSSLQNCVAQVGALVSPLSVSGVPPSPLPATSISTPKILHPPIHHPPLNPIPQNKTFAAVASHPPTPNSTVTQHPLP